MLGESAKKAFKCAEFSRRQSTSSVSAWKQLWLLSCSLRFVKSYYIAGIPHMSIQVNCTLFILVSGAELALSLWECLTTPSDTIATRLAGVWSNIQYKCRAIYVVLEKTRQYSRCRERDKEHIRWEHTVRRGVFLAGWRPDVWSQFGPFAEVLLCTLAALPEDVTVVKARGDQWLCKELSCILDQISPDLMMLYGAKRLDWVADATAQWKLACHIGQIS